MPRVSGRFFSPWSLTVCSLSMFLASCSLLGQGTQAKEGAAVPLDAVETTRLPLFQASRPFEWELSLSTQSLVDNGRAQRVPDETGHTRPLPPVPASLVVKYTDPAGGSETHAVTLEARGHTSLESCLFPKYNILFERKPDAGLFIGLKKIRVGSHCPIEGEVDRFGRIGGDVSVYRESLAYALYRTLVPSLSFDSRVVSVAYLDTQSGTREVHPALVIETDGQFKDRTGLKEDVFETALAVGTPEYYQERSSWRDRISSELSRSNGALVEMFEVAVGNRDYGWSGNASGSLERRNDFDYWNVLGLKTQERVGYVIPKDFDIAGIVAGNEENYNFLSRGEPFPGLSKLETLQFRLLLRLRKVYTSQEIAQAENEFRNNKSQLMSLIDVAIPESDAAGRELAKANLSDFFRALDFSERKAAFLSFSNYLWTIPFLVDASTDAAKVTGCEKLANLMPVEVLETKPGFFRIRIRKQACDKLASPDLPEQLEGWVEERHLTPAE